MINSSNILETINMINNEHLDIRTITMGISLLDCADSDIGKSCDKIYDKICKHAKNLVRTGEDISKNYGIPIINKRISVTPIAMISGSCSKIDPVKFALALERAAQTTGVNFIGGYSALVHKGFNAGDSSLIDSIPQALAQTDHVCASVNIGSTKAGINLDAVKTMGHIVKETAKATENKNCIGAAKLLVMCNAPEDNPFMAGAFHGPGEPDCVINVGVSGPGVIRSAIEKAENCNITEIANIIKKTAFKITRLGELVAQEASKRLDVPFGIIDLSLAPTPAVGDSIAHILVAIGLSQCGAHGTTAALAILNDAVKKGGIMASSQVGGLSGAFIPVTEDAGMIEAVRSKSLSLAKLEAMTSVCSLGLDMIVIPGDAAEEIISAIIADEAAIGMINSKTTAVRLIPAIGKKSGDEVYFGGLLGGGPVIEINLNSPYRFISRGGRIPSPIQSFKN